MPPKTRFTLKDVMDAALSVVRREGIDKLTARAIADELQSSTMPIYSCGKTMFEIEEEIVMVYSARSEIPPKEITFELKNHLASYMIPNKIIYKKSLPLVPSDKNKINKQELKEELLDRLK